MQALSAAAKPPPEHNLLLAALSPAESRKLLPQLEPVYLSSGEVIAETGKRITHGYFPTTAIISITTAAQRRMEAGDEPGGRGGARLINVDMSS